MLIFKGDRFSLIPGLISDGDHNLCIHTYSSFTYNFSNVFFNLEFDYCTTGHNTPSHEGGPHTLSPPSCEGVLCPCSKFNISFLILLLA
jgi:hypothetical protein